MLTEIPSYGYGQGYRHGEGYRYGDGWGDGRGNGLGYGLLYGNGFSDEDTSPLISLDPFEFLALC